VLPAIPVVFRLNAAGKADELQIDLAGQVTFKRRPDPPAKPAATPATSAPPATRPTPPTR